MYGSRSGEGRTYVGGKTFKPRSTSEVGLTVQLLSGQTADAINVKNSSGTKIFYVDKDGNLTFSGSATITIDTAVTGDLTVTGTSTFNGAVIANGDVTLGNAITDKIKVNSVFESQVAEVPDVSAFVFDTNVTYADSSTHIFEVKNNGESRFRITPDGMIKSAGAFNTEGQLIIDTTNAEALLVRKDSDGGDVFAVNTTDSQALFSDGTVSLPSIGFITNPDTGFYISGNQIIWTINNAIGGIMKSLILETKTIQGRNELILNTQANNNITLSPNGYGTVINTLSLTQATGDEKAVQINYTTNKATSGDDYGLYINQTDTASPGTSYLWRADVGGTSKGYLDNTGLLKTAGNVGAQNSNALLGQASLLGSTFYAVWTGAAQTMAIVGQEADDGTAVGVKIGNNTALTTSGAKIASFYNASTEKAYVPYNGGFVTYEASNDGNPEFKIGSSDAEEFIIQPVYDSGAQTIDYIKIGSETASATANKGELRFYVDETERVRIDDARVLLNSSVDLSGSGGLTLTTTSGNINIKPISSGKVIMEQQGDISSGDWLTVQPAGGADLTASSGTQSMVKFIGDVDQSGTAGANILELDMTATATGSGENNIILGQWGASEKFKVSSTGSITSAAGLTLNSGSLNVNNSEWANWSDASSNNYMIILPGADDGVKFSVSGTDGFSNNNFIFTSLTNRNKDHDHLTASADPTVFIHSNTDPDTDNTQWISLTHNQTDALITTGKGNILFEDSGGANEGMSIQLAVAFAGLHAKNSRYIRIGDGTTTGHSIGNDSLLVSGALEVDGASYFDADVTLDDGIAIKLGAAADFQLAHFANISENHMAVKSTGARALILVDQANFGVDTTLAQQTNPTYVVFSATAPGTATDQFGTWTHDTSHVVFGAGTGDFKFSYDDSNGATINVRTVATELTAVSGASVTASNLIPDGAFVVGVTTRITTALGTGNGTTSYQVGDGTDADRWGDSGAVTLGTTTTNADATADFSGAFTSANNVVLTAVWGNFDGTGAVRIVVHYIDISAPGS